MRRSATMMAVVAGMGLGAAQFAAAANTNGTWTNTAGGTWSDADTGNWDSGTVADGAGFTANFNTLDITAATTVSLGQPRTIGNLIFDDTANGTVGSWVLSNNSTPANILTLSGATPTITVNNLGTGTLANSTVTISAVIAGSNGLVKDGTGTVATGGSSFGKGVLVLSGANTYSGGTTISSGTLAAAHNSALGTGDVTVADGAQLQIRGVNIANTININGANALHSTAASGSNLSGTVNLQSNSGIKLASNSGNATLTLSGTLDLNGHTLTVQTINVDPAVNISGVINGAGGITKVSDGTLRITGDNGATYSGTTRLQRGHIAIGHDGALGTGTLNLNIDSDATAVIKSTNSTARTIANAITFTGGKTNSTAIFGLTSGGQTGNLTFTGDVALSTPSNGNFRTFDVRTQTTFDGDISGDPGITKLGNATMILNGTNTYKGNTTISAGTLELDGLLTFIIGASGVNNQINGVGTALLDGIFDFDLSGAGTSLGDTWTIVDVASLTETFSGTFSVNGFADAGGNKWTQAINALTTYEFDEGTGILSVVAIPEPASLGLMGMGCLMMYRRRKA